MTETSPVSSASAPAGKKAAMGRPRAAARLCRRAAEIRLRPPSYFWTCWQLTPIRSAKAVCDRPSAARRAAMRSPTATSIASNLTTTIGTAVAMAALSWRLSLLSLIGLNPGISQNDLASTVVMKKSAVTKLIGELEAKGLVIRDKPKSDRRFNALSLSLEGEALWQDLRGRLQSGRRLGLNVTAAAKDFIIESAYDSIYGSRPIKRFIQSHVETMVAKAILAGNYAEGDTLTVDCRGGALTLL